MKFNQIFPAAVTLLFFACQNNPQVVREPQADKTPVTLESQVKGDLTISSLKDELPTAKALAKEEKALPIEGKRPARPRYSNVRKLLDTFRKAPQQFSVNTQKGFSITGEQGTQIQFPANALVVESGDPVTGPVDIVLEEFYSMADILSARLTTMTKHKLLETGGMIKITASSEGRPCKLQDGGRIEINFATADMKDMQLFEGQRDGSGNMIWTAQARDVAIPIMESVDGRMSKEKLLFLNNFIRDFSRTVHYPRAAADQNIQGKVYAKFFIDQDGRIRRPQIVRNPNGILSKAVLFALHSYPKLEMEEYNYVPINQTFTLPVVFAFEMGEDLNTMYPDAETEKKILATEIVLADGEGPRDGGYGRVIDQSRINRRAANRQAANNVIRSTSLGWINCDRFRNVENGKELIVAWDSPIAAEATYFLVGNKSRSVLAGNFTDGATKFPGLPLGDEVTLIAIAVENGLLKVASREIEISESIAEIEDLRFKEMSKEELALKIESLDVGLLSMR